MDAKQETQPKKADNWAEMSDGQEDEPETVEEKQHVIKPAKKIPPPQKGTKNAQGDYVVTKIEIPDLRVGIKDGEDGSEAADSSDSDSGYGDEEDTQVVEEEESKTGKYSPP